jgi:pantoate--beta-alanine ligase
MAVASEKTEIARSIADARKRVAAARRAGRDVALVPTLGALHAGHMSLIDAAKKSGAYTVVSIFVNPTQFGPNEDLAAYPRTPQRDLSACAEAGVEIVFTPVAAEMYPPGDQTRVQPGPLADALCGPFRPGHFRGVCTVVAKLFQIVQPDAAYFGRKDAQQALIIERMVTDLCMPVKIVTCPLIRDADGLALSSRNVRLGAEDRAEALCLYRALKRAETLLKGGSRSTGSIIAEMRREISPRADVKVDYLSIVDPQTLEPIGGSARRALVAGAIRIGGVRLIDNLLVDMG